MRVRLVFTTLAFATAYLVTSMSPGSRAWAEQQSLTAAQARVLAKEAYIYGFPLVESYRRQYAFFVDSTSKEYKGPWNQVHSEARVVTPADTAIKTPNADVCESVLGADLRAEPLVISVPAVEQGRFYSLQFIDAYTFNFAYVGSRTTGNESGDYLLAGPSWSGDKPAGIEQIIQCETEIALVRYRTQLFNPGDLDNVKKLQVGYRVQPLSRFLGRAAPKAVTKIDFPKPLSSDAQQTSLEFFSLMNFAMRFCPVNPSEAAVRSRIADLGIGGDEFFDLTKWSPEIKKAVEEGMADAWKEYEKFHNDELYGRIFADEIIYGNREHMEGRYIVRMAAAVLGIYGDTAEECLSWTYLVDWDEDKLDATHYRYTLGFFADSPSPADAFWSVTMYELPSSRLVANPINRYVVNSSMIPQLKLGAEEFLSLYLMHESPGKEKESNWLPAPKGPFKVVMRLYRPNEEVLDRRWEFPELHFRLSLADEVELPKEVVRADTEENFTKQIGPLTAAIKASTSVTVYEGLPHQRKEAKVLFDELRTKKTVELHGFPFYDVAIPAKPDVAAKLIDLCGQQTTFGRYGGGKFCGGFHPDWCVEFKNGADVYQILICFGCQEVRLYGPKNKVFSDLDEESMTKFADILKPLQHNRSKPQMKGGIFGK